MGCFKRTALKHVYYLGRNRSPAQVGCMRQALGPGALGKPRGSGWRGRWEEGSGWGTHVNPWLFHFNVWQNSLQIKKKKKKKRRNHTHKKKTHKLIASIFSTLTCPTSVILPHILGPKNPSFKIAHYRQLENHVLNLYSLPWKCALKIIWLNNMLNLLFHTIALKIPASQW